MAAFRKDPGPPPSDEARARLREEAASLDVEDIVDLCCSRSHNALRVSLYLEALRSVHGKGLGEKVQLAACMLCFDLARHGDEARETELHLLMPIVDALAVADAASPEGAPVVRALTDKSESVLLLWLCLVEHAARRDRREAPPVPTGGTALEVDLFDAGELEELELSLEDFAVDDNKAAAGFVSAVDALWTPMPLAMGGDGQPLFAASDRDDVERVEKFKDTAQSFASAVPIAAELQALSALFLASHMRAKGLFGRRNKQRDRLLLEGLEAFSLLPAPPVEAAAWFAAGDVPGAAPFAWEKMAEVILDFVAFTGKAVDEGLDPTQAGFVVNVIDGYVKDARSTKPPPVLAATPAQRRR